MPSLETTTTVTSSSPPPQLPLDEPKPVDDSVKTNENHCIQEQQLSGENTTDSDESSSESTQAEEDEFIVVKLADIRKEVQCPICLGIIRKTRTVMGCLHRFCRECIDKSMRLGNNECPSCRTHCASRRSLRDDPNYDALIAVLYPNIDEYEEEELAFNEEEKARNKQIQDSIAETFSRQAEEVGKKKTYGKTPTTPYSRRQSYRASKGRKNYRLVEQGYDEEEEDDNKDSSSADEPSVEIKPKRQKRSGGARFSQQSSGPKADDDNGSEAKRGVSATPGGGTEIIAWGRGGLRSSSRHGGSHGPNSKFAKNNRISRLVDGLRCPSENDMMLGISLTLFSLDKEKIPNLKRPYLNCNHTSSVKHICQYVAMQTSVEAGNIEMLIVQNLDPLNNSPVTTKDFGLLNPSQKEFLLLREHQTMGEVQTKFIQQHLVLAYRQKDQCCIEING